MVGAWDFIKQKELHINGLQVEQFYYKHEIRGGEGEKLSAEPKLNIINSVMPYKDKFFILDYYQIFSVNQKSSQGFSVDHDFSDVYNEILYSFIVL